MKPALSIYKPPSKKATNITMSMDVYQAAKNLGINIPQVCERVIKEGVALQEWRAF